MRFVVASGNQEAQLLSFFENEEDGVALAPDAVQSENGSIVGVGDERLLGHWGLGREQAAVFGDSANDVEMLRAAGTGVAMANASQPALEAADLLAPSNAEDGVLAVLEHWLG